MVGVEVIPQCVAEEVERQRDGEEEPDGGEEPREIFEV